MIVAAQQALYGWHLALGKVEYSKVHEWQHGLVSMRANGFARDTIITVEHPPVVTVGKDGHSENFENLEMKPIMVERGGDVTYHGPGQLVVYFIFNLTRRGRDIHKFMSDIQDGIIMTLASHGIKARKDKELTGVWVGDKKIASVGVAVKKWITFHGVAFNLSTEMSDFNSINPCGLESGIMTSVEKLTGEKPDMNEWSAELTKNYNSIFETSFEPIDLESIAEDVESQAGGYGV